MTVKLLPDSGVLPKIKKTACGKDVSLRSAFEYGTRLEFCVEVPRVLGASATVMRIHSDDACAERDVPFEFHSTEGGVDKYTAVLDLAELCGRERSGLFYYELLFLRGEATLFTDTANNVDFSLSESSASRFRLLVYEKGFNVPDWFLGGVMYHVFVDRFCRTGNDPYVKEGAVINEDWENGVPQFPENRGDSFPNNVFFGGDLWGVADKLDYLCSLGVSVIYLSPIFSAYSNHKYDTGDYRSVDEMFGGEQALSFLIDSAKKKGIRIILDGVFNHTGDDSIYFDKYGSYGGTGAYSNVESPFRDWFSFKSYPDEYESWWGIDTLPKLDLTNAECREYFTGDGGIIEKYTLMGIGGWRLDVADELPDEFLEDLRKQAKKCSGDEAIVIGEVWENAADKISYGKRRRYFRGRQLDSVMNYPLRNGILSFVKYGDARLLADILVEIYSSYPDCVCHSLMNLLGTHDTERILTLLGQDEDEELRVLEMSNTELARRRLDGAKYVEARQKLLLAASIQFTVYGVPSIFYGDEAGLEGYHDPFCRMPYPWGREDCVIISYYKALGKMRRECRAFVDGDFRIIEVRDGFIAYIRQKDDESIAVLANATHKETNFELCGEDIITGGVYNGVVPPLSARIVRIKAQDNKEI